MHTDAFLTAQANAAPMISALTAPAAVSHLARAKHNALPFAWVKPKQMDLKNGVY